MSFLQYLTTLMPTAELRLRVRLILERREFQVQTLLMLCVSLSILQMFQLGFLQEGLREGTRSHSLQHITLTGEVNNSNFGRYIKMASIVIPQWLMRVFNPAVGGEYPDDRVALQQAMLRENTVPAETKGKMRYHGVDLLTTDKNGNTFFMRDGKKISGTTPN